MNGRHWTAGEILDRLLPARAALPEARLPQTGCVGERVARAPEVAPTNALYPTKARDLLRHGPARARDRGYNQSTLASLQVPESAGETLTAVPSSSPIWTKPRRRLLRHFTHSHAGPGTRRPRTGRFDDRTSPHSLDLVGHPTDQLFIATAQGTSLHPTGTFPHRELHQRRNRPQWSTRHDPARARTAPALVSLARLRLTEQVVNRRKPEHRRGHGHLPSPRGTHRGHGHDVILDGQHDAIDHANHTVGMRFRPRPTESWRSRKRLVRPEGGPDRHRHRRLPRPPPLTVHQPDRHVPHRF